MRAGTLLDVEPSLVMYRDSETGDTPLHWAARGPSGHPDWEQWVKADKAWTRSDDLKDSYRIIIEKLLRLGARTDIVNRSGDTPLHLAIKVAQRFELAVPLLDAGADIQERDANGNTVLHLAVKASRYFGPLTTLLVGRGGNSLLDARNHEGVTAGMLVDNSESDSVRTALTQLLDRMPEWQHALDALRHEFSVPISVDHLRWPVIEGALNVWGEVRRLGHHEDLEDILDWTTQAVSQANAVGLLQPLEKWIGKEGGQDAAIAASPDRAFELFMAISALWLRTEFSQVGSPQRRLSFVHKALRYACLAYNIADSRLEGVTTRAQTRLSECERAFRSQLLLDSSDITASVSTSGYDPVARFPDMQGPSIPANTVAAMRTALIALHRLAVATQALCERVPRPNPERLRQWQPWIEAHEAYDVAISHARQFPQQAMFNVLAAETLTAARALADVGYASEAATWCRRLNEIKNKAVPAAGCNALVVYVADQPVYPDDIARQFLAAAPPHLGADGQAAMPPGWSILRVELASLRDRARRGFDANWGVSHQHALMLWSTPFPIERWQQTLRDDLTVLYGRIIEMCQGWMAGDPPCRFALLGLGSLSRGDCTPFSDLEYAILVDHPGVSDGQPEYRYFQQLATAFEFALLSLGESSGDPVALPKGVRFDSGVGASDPKTGQINSPEGLADIVWKVARRPADETASDTNFGLAYSLLSPRCLYGDSRLLDRYNRRLSEVQCLPLPPASAHAPPRAAADSGKGVGEIPISRRVVARLHCAVFQWRVDIGLAKASKRLDLDRGQGGIVNVKADFIGPLTHLLTTLGLIYGYAACGPHAVLVELGNDKRFSAAYLADWRWALARLHSIRVKYHLAAREQFDEIPWDHLTHAERQDLRVIEWAVLRPLQTMQTAWTDIEKDPPAVADKLALLFHCDPPYLQVEFLRPQDPPGSVLHNAPSLQGIDFRRVKIDAPSMRSLAAALVLRGIGADRCVAIYRDIMHSAAPKDLWALWSGWRQAFSGEPLTSISTEVLKFCRNIACKDGWRAAWEEDQRAFLHHLRAWFACGTAVKDGASAGLTLSMLDPEDQQPATVRTFVLDDSIARQLLTEDGELKPNDDRRPGRQLVLPVEFTSRTLRLRYWVKLYPENPATETLIHAQDCRLNGGHGTPMSVLVRLTLPNGRPVAAQILEDAGDLSLESQLASGALDAAVIDGASFTQALLRTLLVNPEDDKGDDFRLVPIAPGRYALRRIDNERAFFKVTSDGIFLGLGKSLQVKSQLLCLEQMRQPLDVATLAAFCELDPLALLKSWFIEAESLQKQFAALFPESVLRAHFENSLMSLLVVALPEGLANELHTRLEIMQRGIRACGSSVPFTGMDLLQVVQPDLGNYYRQAFDAVPEPSAKHALARFDWRTKTFYGKGADDKPIVTMAGNRAITQSLAMSSLVCWRDVQDIRNSRKFSLGRQLEFLDGIEKDLRNQSRAEAVCRDLGEGVAQGRKAFEKLGVRQKINVLEHVSRRLKQDPQAYSSDVQVRLLRALAGVPFVALDLRPFGSILTDDLLKPLLRGANERLCELDLSHCHAVSAESLEVLTRHCPSLISLRLRGLGVQGEKPALVEIRKAGLIGARLAFPSLRELYLNGSHGITRIGIEAPMLERLGLAGLASLKEVATGSRALRELDARGCATLTQRAFAAIAVQWEAVHLLQTDGCTGLLHQAFRRQFPWLADMAWNDWSSRTIERLAARLAARLSRGATSMVDRWRCRLGVLAWRDAVATLTPAMTVAAEDGVSIISRARGQNAHMDASHASSIASVLAYQPDQAIATLVRHLNYVSVTRSTAAEAVLMQIGRLEPEPFHAALIHGLAEGGGTSYDVATAALHRLFGPPEPALDHFSRTVLTERTRMAPILDPSIQIVETSLRSPASEALVAAFSQAAGPHTVERYGRLLHYVLNGDYRERVNEWFSSVAQTQFRVLAQRSGIPVDRTESASLLVQGLGNSSPRYQRAAILCLQGRPQLQTESVMTALAEVLLAQLSDQSTVFASASALSASEAFWSPSIRALLRVALAHADWAIRRQLLPGLLRADDFPENLKLLQELGYDLRTGDGNRRRDVVRILDEAHIVGRAFIPSLYDIALRDELAEVRAWGLRGISQICLPAVPICRIDLPGPLLAEPLAVGDVRATTGIVQMPWIPQASEREAALTCLMRALTDPALEVTRAAAQMLGKRGVVDLDDTMDAMLLQAQKSDAQTQRYAMLALCNLVEFAQIRSKRIPIVAGQWLGASDPVVRKSALRLLGLSGTATDVTVFAALGSAIQDADPEICEHALRTLGMSGASRADHAIDILETSLKLRHFPKAAVEGLGYIGPMDVERVGRLLKDAMGDEDCGVRLQAVASAARLLQPEAVIDGLFDLAPVGDVESPGDHHGGEGSASTSAAPQLDIHPPGNDTAALSAPSSSHVKESEAVTRTIQSHQAEPDGHAGERPWIARELWEL
jgi:hypothetical protein